MKKKKEPETKITGKQLTSTINGKVLTDGGGLQRHLVIRVTPPGHSRRITPCSATRLIPDEMSDSGSVWNSPISVKSMTSKKSLPAMKLDLITFISDPKAVRSEKYKQTVKEFLEQEKMNEKIAAGKVIF